MRPGRLNDHSQVKKVLWHWLNWCLSCNGHFKGFFYAQEQIHKALKNACTTCSVVQLTLISSLICIQLFCSARLFLCPYICVLFLTNLHNHSLKHYCIFFFTVSFLFTFGLYLYGVGIYRHNTIIIQTYYKQRQKILSIFISAKEYKWALKMRMKRVQQWSCMGMNLGQKFGDYSLIRSRKVLKQFLSAVQSGYSFPQQFKVMHVSFLYCKLSIGIY